MRARVIEFAQKDAGSEKEYVVGIVCSISHAFPFCVHSFSLFSTALHHQKTKVGNLNNEDIRHVEDKQKEKKEYIDVYGQ